MRHDIYSVTVYVNMRIKRNYIYLSTWMPQSEESHWEDLRRRISINAKSKYPSIEKLRCSPKWVAGIAGAGSRRKRARVSMRANQMKRRLRI